MTPEERQERIFQASIGCSSAAVEFLRSVNKPLNVTYIAQTAWEIAKKLEEFMETGIKKDGPSAPVPQPLPTPSASFVAQQNAGPMTAMPTAVEDDLIDLAPVPAPKPATPRPATAPMARAV